MPERADAPKTIWQSQNKPKEMMGSFGFAQGHAMVWTRSGSAYLNRFTPRDKDTAGGLN